MSDMDYEAIAQQLRNCSEIAPGLNKGADAIDRLGARVAELKAENERLKTESKWQPMDTLPKPGSHILVYYPFSGLGHVEDAHVYDDGEGRYIVLFDGDMLNNDPTRWMPYPRMGLNSEGED